MTIPQAKMMEAMGGAGAGGGDMPDFGGDSDDGEDEKDDEPVIAGKGKGKAVDVGFGIQVPFESRLISRQQKKLGSRTLSSP